MAIVAAAPERVIGYVPIEATVPAGDAGLSAFGRWLQRILSEEERREIARIEARPAADAPVALADSAMSVYWRAYFADPGSAPPLPDLPVNLVCARQSLANMVRVSQAGELAATLRVMVMPPIACQRGLRSSRRRVPQTGKWTCENLRGN